MGFFQSFINDANRSRQHLKQERAPLTESPFRRVSTDTPDTVAPLHSATQALDIQHNAFDMQSPKPAEASQPMAPAPAVVDKTKSRSGAQRKARKSAEPTFLPEVQLDGISPKPAKAPPPMKPHAMASTAVAGPATGSWLPPQRKTDKPAAPTSPKPAKASPPVESSPTAFPVAAGPATEAPQRKASKSAEPTRLPKASLGDTGPKPAKAPPPVEPPQAVTGPARTQRKANKSAETTRLLEVEFDDRPPLESHATVSSAPVGPAENRFAPQRQTNQPAQSARLPEVELDDTRQPAKASSSRKPPPGVSPVLTGPANVEEARSWFAAWQEANKSREPVSLKPSGSAAVGSLSSLPEEEPFIPPDSLAKKKRKPILEEAEASIQRERHRQEAEVLSKAHEKAIQTPVPTAQETVMQDSEAKFAPTQQPPQAFGLPSPFADALERPTLAPETSRPQVHIGTIEVIVESAPVVQPKSAPSIGFTRDAGRSYQRRL